MRRDLVLTVIGPDRPGLVELISTTVTGHGGNWEASRMARLAGRFAGILQVTVDPADADRLAAALAGIETSGLRVVVEQVETVVVGGAATAGTYVLRVEMVGNDRPGVIRDVSSALADRAINVEKLATECVAAPMAGGMLLKVTAQVRAPNGVTAGGLRAAIEGRAGDFLVDVIRIGEPDGTSK